MRLFDDDIRLGADAERADAERADAILLEWTRRIQNSLLPTQAIDISWRQWLFGRVYEGLSL